MARRPVSSGGLRDKLRKLAFERGGLVILVIAGVYAALTPTYIVDGENAEFSTLSVLGGAAHPSGYPLYVLWLRVWAWLPGASAAHTAGLATALLGVAACAVLHAACRAWGARPLAASLATAMFAAAPVVLRLHTEAEVFAMNNLVLALVLWLAAERGPVRGTARAVLLALVAGLGLCNHLTCALIAPVGILGVVRGVREAAAAPRAIALAVAALLAGLAPYAYLLVAPSTPISWGQAGSLGDMIAFITRRDYGGPFAFAAEPGTTIDVVANLGAFVRTLGRGWLWLPGLLGVGVLGLHCVRAPDGGEPRRGWQLLAVSWLVAGPILVARFNIAPEGLGLLVCQRFYLVPLLLLAVPVALGLERVLAAVDRQVPDALGAAMATALFVALAGVALPQHRAIASRSVEAGTLNLLRSLPPNAVVISRTDLRSAADYAQSVLGVRPDVVLVAWRMVPLRWYRDRLAARGVTFDASAGGDAPLSLTVAEAVLATGRPLFVDLALGNVLQSYTTYPHGIVFRVLPHGATQLSLDEIVALNKELYAAFDLDYPHPGPDDGHPVGIHDKYAATWAILAKALADTGRAREAHDAAELARELAPR